MIWIISVTTFLALGGFAVFVWSIIDTRKKYYQDYLENRENKNG